MAYYGSDKKRLGIFYFNDQYGVVDKYIEILLDRVMPYISDLYIVVGGLLSTEGRCKLCNYTDVILVDSALCNAVSGYQRAVNCFGQKLLGSFDEIVFFSSSLMGPVVELTSMFEQMQKKNVDLWGIVPDYTEKELLPDYFLVFSGNIIKSYEFMEFWKEECFRTNCTEFFSEKGYICSSYIDPVGIKKLNEHPLLFYPKELLETYGCPFFIRECFCAEYKTFIDESAGQSSYELFQYIQDNHVYNTDVIWDHLLRTCHQSDIVRNLHLSYTLSENTSDLMMMEELVKKRKIALIIHMYRTDMAQMLSKYALNMPDTTDVFITTDTEEKKKYIENIFSQSGIKCFEVRIIPNRGRDVSSKLVGVRDVIPNYDYVCCIHDKKTPHLNPQSIGDSFGYKCFNNILPTKDYANNVITLFEKNPRIGIAVPPEPNHAAFFTTLGLEWAGNYDNVCLLAKKMGLDVPLSPEKEPVAPFGSFFWFRPHALRCLFEHNWNYTDFPEEPIADDGTILHAIERIYPFVAQSAGYLPAIIMSESFAKIEYTNLKYYVRQYNTILSKYGLIYNNSIMCKMLDQILALETDKTEVIKIYEDQIRQLKEQLNS